jgi:type VII secretion-associated serine protease mycosin
MGVTRVLRVLGTASVAAALLLTAAPTAHADAARDKQWPLQVFKAQQRVWPLSRGKGITVAVIDAGVRSTHVDLIGQVLPGKSFAPAADLKAADNGHGTATASLIAGHGHGPNHADGIMGLAPDAKILPLAVDLAASDGYTETADAIRYAVDHGAKVINMSLGGVAQDAGVLAAVAYAESHDVVLVAASGNSGAAAVEYPAAYPGVLAVGGATQVGNPWSESNFGPQLVLVAPATGILGDAGGSDTEYAMGDGTSYATAFVSATAALVRAKYPNLTAGQVINRLIKTAVNPDAASGGTTPDPHYGYGILRPDAALNTDVPAGPATGPLQQAVGTGAPTGSDNGGGTGVAVAPGAAAKASGSSAGLIIGVVAAVVVLLAIVLGVVLSGRRRRAGATGAVPPSQGQQPPYPPYQQQQSAYRPAQQGNWSAAPGGEPSIYQGRQGHQDQQGRQSGGWSSPGTGPGTGPGPGQPQ